MAVIDLPDPPYAVETEATIRARMLGTVDPAFNTDVGDIIYDLLSPPAMEMDQVYDQIELSLEECFASTASGAYLDALAQQYAGGLTRAVDETDLSFRTRVLARLASPVGGGTVADWKTWALASSVDVAHAAVEPVWAGAGTVRIFGAQPDRTPLDAGQLTALETYLAGFTPMGVTLTVAAMTNVAVNVSAAVDIQSGFVFDTALQAEAEALVTEYVHSLGAGDDVVFNEIIAALMETEGVYDIDTLTVNAGTATIAVAVDALPVIGTVTITQAP